MLCGNPVWVILFFSKHEDVRFRELEAIDKQELHTLGVIDTTLELVPAVLIRDPTNHRLLPAAGAPRRRRRSSVVRRSRAGRRRRRRVVGVLRRRRETAGIGDAGDGAANGAAYGGRTWWEL